MPLFKRYTLTFALLLNIFLLCRFMIFYMNDKEIHILEYALCFVMSITLLSMHFIKKHRKLKMSPLTDHMITSEMKSIWPSFVLSVIGILSSAVQIIKSASMPEVLKTLKELGFEPQGSLSIDILYTILFYSYLLVLWAIILIGLYFKKRELTRKKELYRIDNF